MHAQDSIDLIVRRIRSLIEQVLGPRYDSGSSKAALQTARFNKAVGESLAFKLAEAFKSEH